MSVRFAATEPEDMDVQNGNIQTFVSSTSTGLKNSWSRKSFRYPTSTNMTSTGIASLPYVELPADMNTGWFHMRYRFGYQYSTFGYAIPSIGLADALGNFVMGVGRFNGGTRVGAYDRVNGATNLYDTAQVDPSGPADVDFHWNIASSGGFYRIYWDGTLVYEYTGDTSAGSGDVRYICFGGCTGGNGIDWCWHSELIVADEPTIGARLYTAGITAEGTEQDWTGAHTDVNTIDFSDSTEVTATTNGDEQAFTLDIPGSLEAGHVVGGVFLTHRSQREIAAAVTQVQPYLTIGGTQYDIGSAVTAPTSPATTFYASTLTNPADAAAFELADLTGMQLGFRALT